MSGPRILLYDVENSPSLGWYYDRWRKGNIIADKADWFMLSFAWQWLGEETIQSRCLPDYPGYRRNLKNDGRLVRELRDIISQADIIVAHNGDRHDLPKLNARLAYHQIPPCPPVKQIDTYKAAKKYFKFTANSLGHLGTYFGAGSKLPTTGFDLWERCMDGDMEAWPTMREYNEHDVFLLHWCYERIRPFMTNHPRLTDFTKATACPSCQSNNIQNRGFNFTRTGRRQRIQCRDCGAWSATGPLLKDAA